jgi:hypothetical protein
MAIARRHNDQAHPPLEAGATGGTTKAQAISGRLQRFVGQSGPEQRIEAEYAKSRNPRLSRAFLDVRLSYETVSEELSDAQLHTANLN